MTSKIGVEKLGAVSELTQTAIIDAESIDPSNGKHSSLIFWKTFQ